MPDSKASWFLKTLGLIILAAVATSLLTTWVQHLIWGANNVGVSGGAAAGVAAAVAVSRRRTYPAQSPNAGAGT